MSVKQRGVAAVEFVIASGLFFTLLVGIIDWSYLFFTNLSMQHAVREGARYAVTGRSGLSPTPGDRCDAVRVKIREQSMGLFDRTVKAVEFLSVDKDGAETKLESCYGGNQIIVVEVEGEHTPVTPLVRAFFTATDGKYVFSVRTTMKNEAFE